MGAIFVSASVFDSRADGGWGERFCALEGEAGYEDVEGGGNRWVE